ncbi:hypothetical protein K456DRAFT_58375 [Colletotrichum gloeosporioides 23]|nr:hypothetical protein K456DRAFT_58375 [Colletotrichum gloeosporioides 23]
MPCTCCFQAKVPCCFGEKLSRCRTCIKAKKPCDGVLVASTCIGVENNLDWTGFGISEEFVDLGPLLGGI